jgi:FHS family L-fucose permease-like MFS transporter
MGMIAIFLYVGVEVATAGNLSDLLKSEYGIPSSQASLFVSLYWGSLMIGRWTSAAGALGMAKKWEKLMRFVLPFGAFGLFLIVNYFADNEIDGTFPYAVVILLVILGDYLSRGNPARQLVLYSLMGVAALCVGMFTTGTVSIFAFISVGLFCSTLWPCIFTLAIKGMGVNTGRASSLLIMMIMGGGFISILQGWLADGELGIRYSYVVGIVCFAWLVIYGVSRLRHQTAIE